MGSAREGSRDVSSQSLAARAGRWSAGNWKKAFFGWLLLAVVALAAEAAPEPAPYRPRTEEVSLVRHALRA